MNNKNINNYNNKSDNNLLLKLKSNEFFSNNNVHKQLHSVRDMRDVHRSSFLEWRSVVFVL